MVAQVRLMATTRMIHRVPELSQFCEKNATLTTLKWPSAQPLGLPMSALTS